MSRILAGVGAILLAVLVTQGAPLWEFYKLNREALTPIGAFAGGAILAWAAFRQAGIAARQAETARLRHEKQTEADLQRRITESFSKASEQLGSDKIAVRLGGIYTLERVSRESPDDYWTVMETLCAFVREEARWKEPNAAPSETMARYYEKTETTAGISTPPTDIAAVLAVLVRRDEESRQRESEKGWRLDLHGTDLRGANLIEADLSKAVLFKANLSGANLSGANLSSGAILVEANLGKAVLIEANLSGADLSRANLSGAILSGANLSGTLLREAILSKADLSKVFLTKAILDKTDLSGAILIEAVLSGAVLIEADLSGAVLIVANLSGAVLSGANLSRANLNQANLSGAILSKAFLGGADLSEADLSGAALIEANLSGANLSGANLSEAILGKADLRLVTGLVSDQLTDTYSTAKARLPPGMERPAHWPPEEQETDAAG